VAASPGTAGDWEAVVSELTLVLIRFAYLAILWIFVLSAISVVRSDMFGARVDSNSRAERRAERQSRKQGQRQSQTSGRAAKRPRGAPTHVLVVDGANQGERVSLDEAPILVGRGADAAIRLDDDYVSTRHARIARSGDQWFVEDLGSTNGTYIGSHRLTQPTTLQLGSKVRIGKTTLELRK
jgi:pSer/pThr/pTyr-binding forkhead associated (FHA) protein